MELLSIIIPVYNIEKYLPDCLNSVLNQTYQNLEIILVDDGSQDATGKICDDFAERDQRIRVIHKKNGGVSAARNDGLEVANGEYISFVDGDDWIVPDMFQTLYENAVAHNADISCCGIAQRHIDGTTSSCADDQLYCYEKKDLITGFFSDPLIKETMYGPYNKIFRRSLIRDKRFDSRFAIGEDILFVFSCIEAADKVVLDNKAMYQYIKRAGSATTSSFSEKKMHYIHVADLLCERCKTNYIYAHEAAMRWAYVHKLVILRNLNKHPQIKQANQEFYSKCVDFVKEHKHQMWGNLSVKRKIDYILVNIAPWIYRFLPIG